MVKTRIRHGVNEDQTWWRQGSTWWRQGSDMV